MTKPLRIGMIGYGFMGRTHTNGYKRVGDFFPELEYRPVLQAACARSEDKIQAFADQWGYASIETDWRKLIARDDIGGSVLIQALDADRANSMDPTAGKEVTVVAKTATRRT